MVRDWSTGTEDGAEHNFTLPVWSRSGGKKQVLEILEAIRAVLHDQPLLLADHHLVNLRHEFSEARLDPDGDTFHGHRALSRRDRADAGRRGLVLVQLTKFVMAGRVPAIHALRAALTFVGMTILSRRYMTLFANAEEERQ